MSSPYDKRIVQLYMRAHKQMERHSPEYKVVALKQVRVVTMCELFFYCKKALL